MAPERRAVRLEKPSIPLFAAREDRLSDDCIVGSEGFEGSFFCLNADIDYAGIGRSEDLALCCRWDSQPVPLAKSDVFSVEHGFAFTFKNAVDLFICFM